MSQFLKMHANVLDEKKTLSFIVILIIDQTIMIGMGFYSIICYLLTENDRPSKLCNLSQFPRDSTAADHNI